jgi:hypothetical protein
MVWGLNMGTAIIFAIRFFNKMEQHLFYAIKIYICWEQMFPRHGTRVYIYSKKFTAECVYRI